MNIRCGVYACFILCTGCAALESPWVTLAHGRLPGSGCVLYPSGDLRAVSGADDRVKMNLKCTMGTGLNDQAPAR